MTTSVAVVPTIGKKIQVQVPGSKPRTFEPKGKLAHAAFFAFIATIEDPVVIAPMGGPAPGMYERLTAAGVPVQRVPMYELQHHGVPAGADAAERLVGLLELFAAQPAAFYAMTSYDADMAHIRRLTRQRLATQNIRKQGQLAYKADQREVELYFTDHEAGLEEAEDGMDEALMYNPLLMRILERVRAVRRKLAKPGFVEATMADEEWYKKQAEAMIDDLAIYQLLRPADFFPESVLPHCKGLGGALGGGIIAEIGTIRRFEDKYGLLAYARMHARSDGSFPAGKKGNQSNWNHYLAQTLWLWETEQIIKQTGHVWNYMFYACKEREMLEHPEVVMVPAHRADGSPYTRADFTLPHLNSRAGRRVAKQFVFYLYGLWSSIENQSFDWHDKKPEEILAQAEAWYARTQFPRKFAELQQQVDQGLIPRVKEAAVARRKVEPEVDEDE